MESKVESLAGGSASAKFDEQFLRGMQVAMPKKRDNRTREAVIP